MTTPREIIANSIGTGRAQPQAFASKDRGEPLKFAMADVITAALAQKEEGR